MRNALFSSVSSQLYNLGNNEAQTPNLDVSMLQVDSIVFGKEILSQLPGSMIQQRQPQLITFGSNSIKRLSTNVQRNGFSTDSRILKDDSELKDGGFTVSCQSLINYQQGFQSITTSFDNISQQSLMLSRKRSLPQFEVSRQNNLLSQEGISDLVSNNTALKVSKKISKKKKVNSSCEEQWLHQVKNASTEVQEHRIPVRRSQKLTDKITALQKLVSPYGKTDTASVLQEASLYIKLLQEQIQNLFQMLSRSYGSVRILHSQETSEEMIDLRSRGLCLVPISFTHNVTKEDLLDPHNIRTN